VEVNQTLHDVWPSPEPVHYIHFSGLLPPNRILSGANITLHSSLALSYLGSVAARHSSSGCSAKLCGVVSWRPSHSALRGQTVWLLSVLMFILLFATLYRTAAETDIAEDAKGIAMIDETDDSCSRHPLDGAADDRCTPEITGPVAEDKQELLEDVKIEDACEKDTEYQNLSVTVRAFDVHILMFSKDAACDDAFT